mgnify:CR=1 FL=1
MSTGKESSTCITHPANRDRMPYRHRTHLNVLRQGPRHLPDNNKSLHKSTTHHSSVAENAIFQQNRNCSKSNSRSTSDPKTQKCAADRHCKIQQIPMVYEGTPNSSYLTQLPLDQDPEMSTGKESSTCITHPANRDRMPYRHRTHLNDHNTTNGYPQSYIETPH